ncbi:MAG: 50S ribosomal protein L5 [Elusimicrobia bacterium]|nr:50S ribosomal protein L5 [Elusimicrobiota bacterium]
MNKKIDNNLYRRYADVIVPEMKKAFNIKNSLQIPKIEKVIVNMGLKKAKEDKSVLEEALKDMSMITGQKPLVTKARKSISNFSIRKGMPLGCKVTLRGRRMYEFLEKLLTVVIPRIRDFGGLKRSIDSSGNLTIGLRDESIFPEIESDKIKSIKGISITIVTDKDDREKSERLMELIGVPFVKEKQ